jgi:hypothetical protein
MDYMILDSAGHAIASFDNEAAARATLYAIVEVEREAADHLVLLAYDDDGMPVGDARTYVDIAPAVEIRPSEFLVESLTEALVKAVREKQTRYVPVDPWGTQVRAAPPGAVAAA